METDLNVAVAFCSSIWSACERIGASVRSFQVSKFD